MRRGVSTRLPWPVKTAQEADQAARSHAAISTAQSETCRRREEKERAMISIASHLCAVWLQPAMQGCFKFISGNVPPRLAQQGHGIHLRCFGVGQKPTPN